MAGRRAKPSEIWASGMSRERLWTIVLPKSFSAKFLDMFKTSHLRFWLANRSYHQSQIGRAITHSWLYHRSWTLHCQIWCVVSYNWLYPLTIGRATSRRTSLWLNMHLRTTCTEWLHDLRWLMHDPTRSSAIVRSFARHSHDMSCDSLQQIAKPIAACDQNSVSHQTFTIGCMYFKLTEIAWPKNRTIRCD